MEKLTVTARELPSSTTTSTMLAAAAHTSPCVAWPGGAGNGSHGQGRSSGEAAAGDALAAMAPRPKARVTAYGTMGGASG